MYDNSRFYSRDGILVHRKIFEYMLNNPDCEIQASATGIDWYTVSDPQFDPYFKYRVAPKTVEVQYNIYEMFNTKHNQLFDHVVVLDKDSESFIEAWKNNAHIRVTKVSTFTKTETKEINL